ncbi:MAG: electron transfer flavoprotein subunit alpha/FixB family protein [Gemmatimonadota bacterium]
MAAILAVAEQRDGALRKISEEITTAAANAAGALGAEVHALVAGGPGISDAASSLGKFGAAKVLVAESAALRQYDAEALAQLIADQVRKGDYAAVIFGGSSFGKDLAPRVAAKLDVPLATDATAIDVDGSDLVVSRPIYAGRAIAKVVLQGKPAVLSVRPNVFRAQPKDAAGAVEKVAVDAVQAGRVVVRELKAAAGAKLDVAEAPVVISGGRGLRGPENWHLLESLRDAIGGHCALGASRAVVDAGWRPHAEQVGQTGKTVSPQLYFAVGISGAMQHLAGMRSAKTIVAINRDPEAPIFKVADYGLVGDVTEILPKLTEEIRKQCGVADHE